ncbi:MAG: lysozyme inhibitor LprI family protein [Comamonadaceae bacterium]|nr:lysozyme inhibitor LprI family protein [Comamonadaceae bacterium]
MKKIHKAFLTSLFLLACTHPCHAIDDPDTPDYTAAFEARAQAFRQALEQQDAAEEKRFSHFLDHEIEAAYASLRRKLGPEEARQLAAAQNAWLKYYRAEAAFITSHWTRARFGSSYALSRSGYLLALKEARVKTLLGYLKNHPYSPDDAALTKRPDAK